MADFYTVSYTRIRSGWQMLRHINDGVEPEILQLISSAVGSVKSNDLDLGTDLFHTQVVGSTRNNVICRMRVKYGEADEYGREIFFADAVAFPNAYELMKKPENCFSVSNSNYCFSIDKAEEPETLTKLEYEPITAIDCVCEKYGISPERLRDLMDVIGISIEQGQRCCLVCSKEAFRDIAVLITSLLPYSLRPEVCFTDHPQARGSGFGINFSQFVPENAKSRYLNLLTGENNILKNSEEPGYKFFRTACEYFLINPQYITQYFNKLENMLEKLGVSKSTSLADLETADLSLINEEYIRRGVMDKIPAATYKRLFKAWVKVEKAIDPALPASATANEFVTFFLKSAANKSFEVNEEILEEIYTFSGDPRYQGTSVADAADTYIFSSLRTANTRVVDEYLNAIREKEGCVIKIQKLCEQQWGRKMVDDYFIRAAKRAATLQKLLSVSQDANSYFRMSQECQQTMDGLALKLALEEIEQKPENYQATLKVYTAICGENKNIQYLDQKYLYSFVTKDIPVKVLDKIQKSVVDFRGIARYLSIWQAMKDALNSAESEANLAIVKDYFAHNCYINEFVIFGVDIPETPALLCNRILRHAYELYRDSMEQITDIEFWNLAAALLHLSLVEILNKYRADLLYADKLLEKSFEQDPFWNEEALSVFISDLQTCIAKNDLEYAVPRGLMSSAKKKLRQLQQGEAASIGKKLSGLTTRLLHHRDSSSGKSSSKGSQSK